MRILFIQTGGSIDKDYPRVVKGYGFEIGEPAVERILGRVSLNFEYEILSVLRKDSLDITDEDREKIYDVCVKADSGKIIVTHGTDTMIETAKKLSSIKDKVIVLTGAMRPERFRDSDADFNLGTAIGGINVLENGVYIAMNGRVCSWNKVKRDLETGQFVEK
jgi:L-asparaginase